MDKTDAATARDELTLILLFLTRIGDHANFNFAKDFYAWRGYSFDAIDELERAGYVDQGSYRSQSRMMRITKEGLEQAEKLLEKYGIEDFER